MLCTKNRTSQKQRPRRAPTPVIYKEMSEFTSDMSVGILPLTSFFTSLLWAKKFMLINRGGCTGTTEVGVPENGKKLKNTKKS